MASTFFGLTIGTSGLFASKSGLNVTAHNIANVETDGFSRQHINQRADTALRTNTHAGMLGTGAKVLSTEQSRSQYYDEKFRSNNAISGKYEQRYYFMKEIESYLNEVQLEGFTVSFDNMFNSLQELAKDSSSLTVRTQVVNYAGQLTDYFNSLYTNLTRVQEECNYEIKNQVQKINSYAGQIATLTKQINTVEVGGENANDLRDQRNLLVDELSNIINVTAIESEVGDAGMHSFIIRIDGNTLVDTYETFPLSIKPREYKMNQCDVEGLYDIYWANGDEFKPASGTLNGVFKALFEVRDGNNEETLTGVLKNNVNKGDETVTITKCSINDVRDLNIPLEGHVKIGNGEYTYDSFEVNLVKDAQGNDVYEYSFHLTSPARRDYLAGTDVINGTSIDYKGIPYYMAQLNQFLRTFAESYNNVHCSGEDLDGQKGQNFFSCRNKVTGDQMMLTSFGAASGAGGADVFDGFFSYDTEEGSSNVDAANRNQVSYYRLTAENFCISEVMAKDVRKLVTTDRVSQGVSANNIAQALIDLKGDRNMFKQGAPSEFLRTLVAEIGIDTKAAKNTYTSQNNILATVENQRLSVAGVDTDEEAMNLVKYQEAYNLNAKVISVMQQIYDKLINETGL